MRELVYKTSVVDRYSSLRSDILGMKDRRRKEMLRDVSLLMFMDPTKAYQIMMKTTIFAVAPQEEKLSLHSWLLFIMLGRSLVSRYMMIGPLAAQHNQHRKHG
jgi:hypothetical protein